MTRHEKDILQGFELQKVNQCPICASSSRRPYDRREDVNRSINCVQCSVCELVYMDSVVSNADLMHLYEGYNQYRLTSDEAMDTKRHQMYSHDVDYAMRFLTSNHSSLLDIGCGEGDFLAKFPSTYERFGVEIDSAALTYGQFKHPTVTFLPSLTHASQAILKNFDAVLFRGTLQYMTDLHSVVEFCRSRIHSGGLLFLLATPNADSLLARVLREDWGLYNSIEHRYCFGVKQLQLLFADDFILVDYDLPYFRTPYENYMDDLSMVCSLLTKEITPGKQSVPFFGSMMNVVFERK
jgi:SAM-dependent methyltransferase